jgi:hypothetical protein
VLADGLQWELAERGLEIVSKDRLRVAFEPLLSADRRQLDEVLLKNRDLIEQRFGREGFEQLKGAPDADVPIVLSQAFAEALEKVKQELAAERQSRIATEKAAAITSAQKSELMMLQAQKKAKRTKDRRRQKQDRGRKRQRH